MFNLVFDSKFKTFTFDFIKTNMFNFDSFGNSTFYGDPYCRIGYVYSAPCYYTDNSYSFGYSDNCIPSQAYYTPSAYPFNFTPAYPQPDKEQLKNPTLPTRDSQIQEQEVEKNEISEVPAPIIKTEEIQDEPIKLEQKYGRNIVSNIFHSIIRWTSSEEQFEKIIESVITVNKMTIKLPQFRQKLKQKTSHLKGYVNAKVIRSLYLGRRIGATRSDLQFSKILRILSKIYIKKYHINHIYFSSKIKKKSRSLHFKRMRVLLKMIK